MSVQFAAIPVRALADARLNGSYFRLLGAIARYDRFGRNGTGCYVNARQLAKDAAIHCKHLGRQTQRLELFGYINIDLSRTDKRRKIYSVIYDEAEIVTTGGDNRAEIATNTKSQVVDPIEAPDPKRLSEAYLRDLAKPRARDGEAKSQHVTLQTNYARQGDRGGGNSGDQGHFMRPFQGGKRKPKTAQTGTNWKSWIEWLATEPGYDGGTATLWIMRRIDQVKAERDCSNTVAEALVDAELKKWRKLGEAPCGLRRKA